VVITGIPSVQPGPENHCDWQRQAFNFFPRISEWTLC